MRLAPFDGRRIGEVVDLLQQTMTAEPITPSLFVRKVVLDPNFGADGAPMAIVNDRVVGFALGIVRRVPHEDAPDDAGRGYLTMLGVAAAERRKCIGSVLVTAVEEYAASRGCTRLMVSPYSPGYWIPGVDVSAYRPALVLLTNLGYTEVSRPLSMDCALAALRVPAWVAERCAALRAQGVAVVPYAREHVHAMMQFLRSEFPGDWQRYARDAASRIEQGDAATRVWLAVESSGAVVGFSHHEGERFGPIGVHSRLRGQGIGHALLYETLGGMRAQGLHTAWFMWSDDGTAARIYSTAGFVETRRFAVLRKDLA